MWLLSWNLWRVKPRDKAVRHWEDKCHPMCSLAQFSSRNRSADHCLIPHPIRQMTHHTCSIRPNLAYGKQATSCSTNIGYIPGYWHCGQVTKLCLLILLAYWHNLVENNRVLLQQSSLFLFIIILCRSWSINWSLYTLSLFQLMSTFLAWCMT